MVAPAAHYSATPTFLLGRTTGDTLEGVLVIGAAPFNTFDAKIKDLLAPAGAGGVILAIPVAGLLSVSVRHWREYRAIEQLVRTSAQCGNTAARSAAARRG